MVESFGLARGNVAEAVVVISVDLVGGDRLDIPAGR